MILSLENIAKTYRSRTGRGDVEALKPVDLNIAAGSFVGLVGPSGCGKSTMLNIIAGLLTPSTGRVLFEGREMDGPSRDMGFMFQAPVLLPWRTVKKNVLLPAEVFGLPVAQWRGPADEAIEMVGLSEFSHALPQQLSGGMQQRVALARVLTYKPKVLLMDEPFGALDEFTREAMNLELQRLIRPSGVTVIFVTHNISEAVFLSDLVVVMSPRPGRVVGTVEVPVQGEREIDFMREQQFTDLMFRVREMLKLGGPESQRTSNRAQVG